MTENDLRDRIVKLATEAGWRVHWTAHSEGAPEGEADLRFTPVHLCQMRAPLEVELKTRDSAGRVSHRTDAQRRYANDRIMVGVPVVEVLLPDDAEQLERWLGLPAGSICGGAEWVSNRGGTADAFAPLRHVKPPGVAQVAWDDARAGGPRVMAALLADERCRVARCEAAAAEEEQP